MPIPSPKPRHTVEKSNHFVRVTLPSKKNISRILWFSLWLFGWAYMVIVFLAIAVGFGQRIVLGNNLTPPVQPGHGFIYFSIVSLILFLVFFAGGILVIQYVIWSLAGKEVIEANPEVLKISRQTFVWKRVREYAANEVKNLRWISQPPPFSLRGIQRLFGSNGMIAFDYGAKTFQFGLEIEEAEAKQIIFAIKEGLPQPNAG